MELNSRQIQEILPHRYPFLLVDRILDFEPGKWARGIKCVSANEMQFLGHFPGNPVMPGVLIIEALAQVGAVCTLTVPEHQGKLALFGGIREARFRQQGVARDVLELSCEILRQKGPWGREGSLPTVDGKVGGQRRADVYAGRPALTEARNAGTGCLGCVYQV